jgi:ABC-type lipopolysaccharide export system ATPase subunit
LIRLAASASGDAFKKKKRTSGWKWRTPIYRYQKDSLGRPNILLLDEPSMGLAPIFVETIFDTIRDINRKGTTILLVEQNALMAFQIASRGYIIQTGTIVLEDTSRNLESNEMIRDLYLGGDVD